jgi:hypothetical protein
VVIVVAPVTPSTSGGQVICEVKDDGCFDLSSEAATFLLAAADDLYTLTVNRYRFTELAAGDDAWVTVETISESRSSLKNSTIE